MVQRVLLSFRPTEVDTRKKSLETQSEAECF